MKPMNSVQVIETKFNNSKSNGNFLDLVVTKGEQSPLYPKITSSLTLKQS